MTVIYAFLAIGIIIFLHELGHFMAAKLVGVPVERVDSRSEWPVASTTALAVMA